MTDHEVIRKIKKELFLVHEVESCDISHTIETKTVSHPGCHPDFTNMPTGWEEVNVKIRYKRKL